MTDQRKLGTPRKPPEKAPECRKRAGVDERHVEAIKELEVELMLYIPNGVTDAIRRSFVARAFDLYESLSPSSGLEGMLAAQMVGTHYAALECLKRAAIHEQTFEGRDINLKHAASLMRLFANQVAALDKHRGKGQQKVTVEHVNVEAGGQAIVGHVETGANATLPGNDVARLEEKTEIPFGSDQVEERTKQRRHSEE